MPAKQKPEDQIVIIHKNNLEMTDQLNLDSSFGMGVVTGNQEVENGWFEDLFCAIIFCCSCGGGGGSTQMEKAE